MPSSFETKLPAEMRVEIYTHLLTFDNALTRPATDTPSALLASTSILAVSKLMHQEAFDILYERNTFKLPLRHLCSDCMRKDSRRTDTLALPYKSVVVEIGDCRTCCWRPLIRLITTGKLLPAGHGVSVGQPKHLEFHALDKSINLGELPSRMPGTQASYQSVGVLDLNINRPTAVFPNIRFTYPRMVVLCAYLTTMPTAAFLALFDATREYWDDSEIATALMRSSNGARDYSLMAGTAVCLLDHYYAERQAVTGIPLEELPCWAMEAHGQDELVFIMQNLLLDI